MRVALVVSRSLDDAAVLHAATLTYRELIVEGHDVDCFVMADPRFVGEFADGDRTQLCVVDHGYRAERWEARSAAIARATKRVMARVAAARLRALVTRAHQCEMYDAFVQPRWPR